MTGFELDYNYKYEDVEREITDITEKEIVNYLIELIREEIQTFLKYIFKNKKTNIKIKLNVNSHSKNNNNNFKSLSNLSYGQKSVAMLTIILEGFTKLGMDIPLIIDQPEDQLDNAYISEHLINNIRKIKGKRQVIFVTHNPNIPISGDAENVFCLKSDGINGWLLKNGSIDKKHILDFIIKTLEGGEEALRLRLNKYSELDLKMIKCK
jgi:predicted ATPase